MLGGALMEFVREDILVLQCLWQGFDKGER
jgi:hypothetical protein